jgi:hypothetical protein
MNPSFIYSKRLTLCQTAQAIFIAHKKTGKECRFQKHGQAAAINREAF